MNLGEFSAVVTYVINSYKSNDFNTLYAELESLIDQNRANPTDELSDQVKVKVDQILKIHKSIQPTDWSYTQNKYFEKLGAYEHFGTGARARINEILRQGSGDSGFVLKGIRELHATQKSFFDRITQIQESMGPLLSDSQVQLEDGQAIIQLVFDEDVSVDRVDELSKRSEEWNRIFGWFTEAISDNHASPKILSISKESPVTITLEGNYAVIAAIAWGVKYLYDLKYKSLKIEEQRLLNQKIKLEDPGNVIDNAFKKQIEKVIANGVEWLKKNIIEKYKTEGNGDTVTKLDMAIDSLKDFIFKGGRADVATEVDVADVPQDDTKVKKGIGYKFQLSSTIEQVETTEALIYSRLKMLEARQKKEEETKKQVPKPAEKKAIESSERTLSAETKSPAQNETPKSS